MNGDQVSLREFFEQRFADLKEKADHIISLQEATNGRVRAAEKSIAVLTWAYGLAVAVIAWLAVEVTKK